MEEMCPDIPDLERLMRDIGGLAESGARYTEMPHVIEVTLPMLCNYLPRWWERGPDTRPRGPWATAVTGQHLNALLGNILRIVVNNLGIDEASWMKRLAGGQGGGPGGLRVLLVGLGGPKRVLVDLGRSWRWCWWPQVVLRGCWWHWAGPRDGAGGPESVLVATVGSRRALVVPRGLW